MPPVERQQPIPLQQLGGFSAVGGELGSLAGGPAGAIGGAGAGFLLDTVISGFQADKLKRANEMQMAETRRLRRQERMLQQQKSGESSRQFNLELGLRRDQTAFNQQQILEAGKVNKFQRLQDAIFQTMQRRGALRQQFKTIGVV